MKKIHHFLFLSIILLSGCTPDTPNVMEEPSKGNVFWYCGHRYIRFFFYIPGDIAVNAVHDPDCPSCKQP